MDKVKHIEIAGVDGDRLQAFYARLFNWTITNRDIGGFTYGDVNTENDPGIGFRHEPEGKAELVIYIEVSDLDASFEHAKSLGAAIRIPPMQYGELRFALIEDPEGNPIGLTQE